jgi:hypothetical protein|tara:strand:+ start:111 stop:563 length:453 start_codon:yes stop_codon:yes gene_type:complete
MGYQFKCRSCNKFIYTDNLSEENTLYNCENCEAGNWINSDFDGLIEIDKDEFENKTIDSNESLTEVNNTLTDKYVVLELYKGLAFLLMIAATGFFIYSLVQFFDLPKSARNNLGNAMTTTTVSYFISMFSLYCLTMIINFLFDLDKKTDK